MRLAPRSKFSADAAILSNVGPASVCQEFASTETTHRRFIVETKRAVERALKGEGPTLIEANTYRHGGHHVNDPGFYMDQEVLAEWKARDPVQIMSAKLKESEAQKIETRWTQEIDAAVEFAKNSPEPSVEEFLARIRIIHPGRSYQNRTDPYLWISSNATGEHMAEIMYREALNKALFEEMEKIPTVFIMGENIGERGGSYKVTEGLLDIFGPGRVIDTPLC